MKKLLTAFVFLFAITGITFAQSQAFDVYKFKSQQDAEKVIKVLNDELRLNGEQLTKVKELFLTNAKSQQEIWQKAENNEADRANMLLARQTIHLESNLRGIVGEEIYKVYEKVKPTLAEKVKAVSKN